MFTPRLLKIKIHSRRVLIFKRSLPIFAFLLASLIFVWPALVEQKEKFSLVVKDIERKPARNIDMQQVRFFSKDTQSQPFTILSTSVLETDPVKKIITLENPKAIYLLKDGVELDSKTNQALAYQEEKYLYFENRVVSTSNTGYIALSSQVKLDYGNGKIDSDAPFNLKGPAGTVQSEGIFLENKGDHITFKNKTKSVIFKMEKPINFAQKAYENSQDNLFDPKPEDIVITSSKGQEIDQIKQEMIAYENVVILQEKKQLNADKVVLLYRKEPKRGEEKIRQIDAFGSVKIFEENRTLLTERFRFLNEPFLKENEKERAIKSFFEQETANLDLEKHLKWINLELKDSKNSTQDRLIADRVLVYKERVESSLKQTLIADRNARLSNSETIVTANRITFDDDPSLSIDERQKGTAEGNVIVVQDSQKITADKMTLYYDSENSANKIIRIIAEGHVVAMNGKQKMTGDRGVYIPKTHIIKMNGNVHLHEGNSLLVGDEATFNLNTGIHTLVGKNSPEKETGMPPRRVKGRLIPAELEK